MCIFKRLASVFCAAVLVTALCGFSNPFAKEDTVPAEAEPTRQVSFRLAGVKGSPTELSARELERRLGLELGELTAITLTKLPDGKEGKLLLDGKPVAEFQELSREQVDRLTYYAKDPQLPASFSFIPQCSQALHVAVSIHMQEKKVSPPTVKDSALSTMAGIPAVKNIALSGGESEELSYYLASAPQKGTVVFSGGSYTYTPYQGAKGSDRFAFYGVDAWGNTTQDAAVSVWIDSSAGVRFEDMAASPSEYAAVRLWEAGILSGEQVGERWMFYPQRQVSRLEFVMMLLAALEEPPIPCVNTGLEGDSRLPVWAKPYIYTAIQQGIITEGSFEWDTVPTRAEAVLLTHRAAAITDVKRYNLDVSDLEEIPQWALPSYVALGAYQMLDFYDGAAHPQAALTRERAADLIWQLYKLENK